jgi:hypothetical protein
MKVFDAFRLGGLATRRFPVWLHAFNILCGIAALAIAGFGIYFWVTREQRTLGGVLSGPRGARVVDREILVAKLEDPKEAAKLGKMLRDASDEDTLIVLEAAREEVLPGSVVVADEFVMGEGLAVTRGRVIVGESLGISDSRRIPPSTWVMRRTGSDLAAQPDGRFEIAYRMLLMGDARIRRRAVERLISSKDPRAGSALRLACDLPAGEEATAQLAQSATHGVASEEGSLPDVTSYLTDVVAGPIDDDQRARALVGLGIVKARNTETLAVVALKSSDPIVRERAGWSLGRIGSEVSRPALEAALAKETYAPAREAMQKALDRLPR